MCCFFYLFLLNCSRKPFCLQPLLAWKSSDGREEGNPAQSASAKLKHEACLSSASLRPTIVSCGGKRHRGFFGLLEMEIQPSLGQVNRCDIAHVALITWTPASIGCPRFYGKMMSNSFKFHLMILIWTCKGMLILCVFPAKNVCGARSFLHVLAMSRSPTVICQEDLTFTGSQNAKVRRHCQCKG